MFLNSNRPYDHHLEKIVCLETGELSQRPDNLDAALERLHSICLGARIFAVADAVDAITSNRPYRKARPFEQAAEELTRGSGNQFDPAVVRAFIEVPPDTWRERRYAAAEADRVRHVRRDRRNKLNGVARLQLQSSRSLLDLTHAISKRGP